MTNHLTRHAARALAAGAVGALALTGSATAAEQTDHTAGPAVENTAVEVAGGVVGLAADTPVPPGSPGDVNGNGILDSSETPDNPDLPGLPTQVPPGSPGDANGNGQLDSSETPDNPDT